jgi:hypothetical protein
MRLTGLGIRAPYAAIVLVRVAYLFAIAFFMPESLPKKSQETKRRDDAARPQATVSRLTAAPRQLLQPFKVLLPTERDGKRDWRLTLVALSYLFFMLIPVRPPSLLRLS